MIRQIKTYFADGQKSFMFTVGSTANAVTTLCTVIVPVFITHLSAAAAAVVTVGKCDWSEQQQTLIRLVPFLQTEHLH